jgi:flagellar FliL protein
MSQPETTTGQAPKKSKLKLIIIALVVLLLAGAGGGFFYFRSSSVAAAEKSSGKSEKGHGKSKKSAADEDEEATDESADEEHAKDEHAKDGKAKDEHAGDVKSEGKASKEASAKQLLSASLPDDEHVKQIVEMQPFIVNLTDSEQARYLRLTVSLGIGESEAGHEGKPDPLFITRVRNAMLAVLSVKKSDDILTVEGKTKLRKELLKAAKAASHEPQVEAIYITDLIVQM